MFYDISESSVFKSISIFSQSGVKCFIFCVQSALKYFTLTRKNVYILKIIEEIIIVEPQN